MTSADIIIGGGSLSALAAAITAANISKAAQATGAIPPRIVLLEPTDWPGGQLTASNVPPDFGAPNSVPENLPASFVNLLLNVAGPDWKTNPGLCWVSYKCFKAQQAAEYIKSWLEEYSPYLTVYYNTVIKSASRNQLSGRIEEIVSITRSPISGSGWENNLSTNVIDWYSEINSDEFLKNTTVFRDMHTVIEGTEWGDILVTAELDFV